VPARKSAADGCPSVDIYTDGGAIGNPGPGGYGAVLVRGDRRLELAGGYRLTTNNRMEIMGAIAALEALKGPCAATLFSDSQYLVNAIYQGWAKRWRANGWKRNAREKALNPDLWERLLELLERHQVTFIWVRGHSGHAENERCHDLSMQAAQSPGLPPDEEYEGTTG